MNKKNYSKEEINFLKENISKFGVQICANKLDRPVNGIINKCRRLGIKLNDKCNASTEEINNLRFNTY